MAELARLLTFMYEEDVRKVLAMYDELFGDACNEGLLLDFLGSPTRQAVMLARAYNAKERKLQINSTSREDDALEEDDNAEFIRVMTEMRRAAEDRGIVYGDEQFGFSAEEPATPVREAKRVWEEREGETSEVRKTEENPQTADEKPAENVSDDAGTEERKEDGKEDAAPTEAPPRENVPAEENVQSEKRTEETAAVQVEDTDELRFDFSEKEEPVVIKAEKPVETVKKVNVFLAVIYAIFAVPITLVICTVLLIPTFLALALAAAGVFVSFKLISSAFGGFAIFADIMVVLGAGLVTAALGLLFLWMFVWFIGGAIAGVISGAIRLGEKLCTREVEVR